MNFSGGGHESHQFFQQLMKKAEIKFVKQVDPSKTYGFYLKAAEEIYSSANKFHKDGLLEEAFVLYCRFTMLFVNILKKDKLSNEQPYFNRFDNLKKLASYALDQCESIKKNLLEQERNGLVSLNDSSSALSERKFHSNNNNNRMVPTEDDEFESLRVDNNSSSSQKSTINSNSSISTSSTNMVRNDNVQQQHVTTNTLSKVKIDIKLIEKFNLAARNNTVNNLEFCGILSGFLVETNNTTSKEGYFQITHCFIPKQDCTEDSCRALNEITVFNRQESLGLVTLGWIHTHPTQDCFLSTVDLKTQYGYQCSLPEAIGVVIAPRASNKNLGIFRIKDTFSMKDKSINGMERIRSQFRKNIEWGNNHEATDGVWFEECYHVQVTKMDSDEFSTIVDLR